MSDAPDNVDRALEMLRRQFYDDVADYFEQLHEQSQEGGDFEDGGTVIS